MSDAQDDHKFSLDQFFPYLVRLFYRDVSESVYRVYQQEYGLTVSEWRTLAVLGCEQPLSASEIVKRSSIDKVKVSRAITGLSDRGFLEREIDSKDRRKVSLVLTPEGQAVFEDLSVKVLKRESDLLQGVTPEEFETLVSVMRRVRENAGNQ